LLEGAQCSNSNTILYDPVTVSYEIYLSVFNTTSMGFLCKVRRPGHIFEYFGNRKLGGGEGILG